MRLVGEEEHDDVVRARRVEIVDEAGRVRAVLGEIEGGHVDPPTIGLGLYTEAGERRASIAMDESGAWVVLELAGNALVQLGVNEVESDAFDTRAFIHLSAADGSPLVRWRVADDGTLIEDRWEE